MRRQRQLGTRNEGHRVDQPGGTTDGVDDVDVVGGLVPDQCCRQGVAAADDRSRALRCEPDRAGRAVRGSVQAGHRSLAAIDGVGGRARLHHRQVGPRRARSK